MADRAAAFGAQVKLLRDSALGHIDRNSSGQASSVFGVYRELFSEYLRYFRVLEDAPVASATPSEPSGDEWRTLLRDLYDIGEVAVSASLRIWINYNELLFQLVMDASRAGEVGAVRSYLRVAGSAWEGLLQADSEEAARRRQILLTSFDNYLTLWVPSSTTSEQRPALLRAGLAGTTDLVRAALNVGHDVGAAEAAGLLSELTRPWRSDAYDAQNVAGAAAYLLAYGLYLQIERGREPLPRARGVLREVLNVVPGWELLTSLRDEELAGVLEAKWWELTYERGRAGGVLLIDHYLRLAVLAYGRVRVPSPGEVGEVDEQLARSLLAEIEAPPLPRVTAIEGLESLSESFDRLRPALTLVAEAGAKRRQELLHRADLDPALVLRFRAAVAASCAAPRLLTELDPRVEAAPGTDALGFDGWVPKEYFVDQPDVFADPQSLADDLCRAVHQREDEEMLELFKTALPETAIGSLDELPAAVDAALGADLGGLVVTNAYQVLGVLAAAPNDPSEAGPQRIRWGRVLRVFVDRPPFALCLKPDVKSPLRRTPLEGSVEGDIYDERAAILVGLSDARDGGGLQSGEPPRAQVRVRVLEGVQRASSDADAGRWITLPPDTW